MANQSIEEFDSTGEMPIFAGAASIGLVSGQIYARLPDGSIALLSGGGAAGILELTGDGTAGPGSGSQVFTLANSGATAGVYNSPTSVTVDAKGRITAMVSSPVLWPTSVPAGRILFSTAEDVVGSSDNIFADTSQLGVHDANGEGRIGATFDSGTLAVDFPNSPGFAYFFVRSRGTRALPAIVEDGDRLGTFFFLGHDGTTGRTAASIYGEVEGTPGVDDLPAALVFAARPVGSSDLVTWRLSGPTGAASFGASSASGGIPAFVTDEWDGFTPIYLGRVGGYNTIVTAGESGNIGLSFSQFNGSADAPTATVDGDNWYPIDWHCWDGTASQNPSYVNFVQIGEWPDAKGRIELISGQVAFVAGGTQIVALDADPLADNRESVRFVLDYAGGGSPDILIARDPVERYPSIWDTSGAGNLGLESDPWDQAWLENINGLDAPDQELLIASTPAFAGLSVASLVYPVADGNPGDVFTSDGAGNITLQPAPGGNEFAFVRIGAGPFPASGTIRASDDFSVAILSGVETFPFMSYDGNIQIGDTDGNRDLVISGYTLNFNNADVIQVNGTDCVTSVAGFTKGLLTAASIEIDNVKATLQTAENAATGLLAGALSALTNASLVITDGTGQVYRVPAII